MTNSGGQPAAVKKMLDDYQAAAGGVDRPERFVSRLEACGCGLEGLPVRVIYCSLHAQAGVMREALEQIAEGVEGMWLLDGSLNPSGLAAKCRSDVQIARAVLTAMEPTP